ncbi:MAG: biotin transporter BioY [Actinobacteria bacterium]|jgi:biotin transport system substrate-specific component|uniref:biotin transporter BioY n=1 Tax=Microbacterium TaxID=33882 RepID=UPI000C4EB311|nr:MULTISPECIES: biotin transporter BioY [Microbacterium]RUA25766.1 MAG: biotin transporter BioY [Actinomycetota bacterium]HIE92638.1 biotin transporter BioY [Acidobacteriota bacterium]MBU20657.1 BioY protein [Microbacterium sp.]MCC4268499.1 biotin transporter BioY [Microbacterium schleiferi]RCL88561.1 MAG: biotin transporter BioY [Microbacterium sp.]|tara:strand:- start:1273 stop:1911 length:639 start_codon:yes stop_codon:yes gene_type:complete
MTTAAAPATHTRVLADIIARPSSRARAFAIDAGLVLAGVAVVALLAKVSFFIGPIPITGQTLGVILVGAALGSARGAATMTTYMFVGLLGLPVFAGPVAGPAYLLAPSFGFILGFIPAAFVAGWFAERAWDRKPLLAFAGFVIASVIPFVIGVPYMAFILSTVMGQTISPAEVLNAGLWPFIVPGLIKAGFAALLIPGAWALVRRIDTAKKR